MSRCYSLSTMENLIARAAENGYTVVQVSEGVLGLGHVLLVAPRPGFWNFEITERPAGEWGCVHALRRFRTPSKRVLALAGMEVN